MLATGPTMVAFNPASHKLPRDRRSFCRDGKTSHFQTVRRGWGKGSRAVGVATMVSPFGMHTFFCHTGQVICLSMDRYY